MKSLLSLVMVMLLATSMVHLAVAQYSGTMNTKLLYGVAREVRSGVRYGMVTVGEGLQHSDARSKSSAKLRSTKRAQTTAASHKNRPIRTRRSRASYARYALR